MKNNVEKEIENLEKQIRNLISLRKEKISNFNLLRNNADLMKLVMRVGSVSGKNKYRRK